MSDIFNGFGIEVFIDENDFLKIKETLSRIGVLSKKDNTLYQSCHILHKQISSLFPPHVSQQHQFPRFPPQQHEVFFLQSNHPYHF